MSCDSRGPTSLLGALARLEQSRTAFSQEECAVRLAQLGARALLAVESDWVSAASLRQGVAAGAGMGQKVDDRQVQVGGWVVVVVVVVSRHGCTALMILPNWVATTSSFLSRNRALTLAM